MLSKKTKYAIHALIHLAKKYGNEPVHIQTIAEKEHIPKKFLEAILIDLKNNGILASQQGRSGGYYLKVHPRDVHLAKIVRLFDGAIGLLPCVTHVYYEPCEECDDEETCSVRDVFKRVRDATVEILKASTLEEMINLEKRLIKDKK